MEWKLFRIFALFGVPGLALGVFFFVAREFKFRFAEIEPIYSALIAVLFLIIVGGITWYALYAWRPGRGKSQESSIDTRKVMVFDTPEESVTLTWLLRSIQHDLIRIDAHTHTLGVAAEYEWMRKNYPGSKREMQQLVSFKSDREAGREVFFDVLKIVLPDGRKKDLYFDISSFFTGNSSSVIDPESFIAEKIKEIYALK
jgi:hypothetical protein